MLTRERFLVALAVLLAFAAIGTRALWDPDEGRYTNVALHMLESVFEDLGPQYQHVEPRFDDAGWVGCRLAELLPIDLEHKQHCLELFDPVKRLEYLEPLLKSLGR